jgi:hypothetical protein
MDSEKLQALRTRPEFAYFPPKVATCSHQYELMATRGQPVTGKIERVRLQYHKISKALKIIIFDELWSGSH